MNRCKLNMGRIYPVRPGTGFKTEEMKGQMTNKQKIDAAFIFQYVTGLRMRLPFQARQNLDRSSVRVA
jgi:hypothetical protein